MPINLRTHGHGHRQGYLDLNFLIPELVERIDYTKGPYVAAAGGCARGAPNWARFEGRTLMATLVGDRLSLGSELVVGGDSGTTEPNAASRRWGTEATLFWRPVLAVALDAAAAFTHARFTGVATGENRVPNSVGTVLAAGMTASPTSRLALSLRLRHFGAAPLIEDDRPRSPSTRQRRAPFPIDDRSRARRSRLCRAAPTVERSTAARLR